MENNFLSTFTPSLMSSNILEDMFVQRHKLVEDLIKSVCHSAATANKHFRLLIGMRGIGKTHTIALIYHRLKKREDLKDKLLIAWLTEEEWSVSSWLLLLIRIFKALETEYPELYKIKLQEKVESLYELSPDDATYQAERMLKEFIGNKTLLLLTENLDEIFNGLGDIGQKQFRAYLQNYSLFTIIATSQSLFAGVSENDVPFYGFFNTQCLDKLTIEEATDLLRNIAKLQEDQELELFIKSSTGKDRIKTIHHLAGGNHRVYVIFSQFLTRNSLDELVKPVMKTLDELTPYYQAKMQHLSPQQRKMIELLCEKSSALSVKEIAKRCFISHQTASGQLKELRKKGYVTAESLGRESFYELQEPLMRICLEAKKHRGEPIKLFIDFLRIWYTEKELQERLKQLSENCLEREYINHALAAKESLMTTNMDKESIGGESLVIQGIEEANIGNIEIALELFNEAIKKNDRDYIAWYNRGNALGNLGRLYEEIASYDQALELKSDYVDAWYNKGNSLGKLGRFEEAIACYDKALESKINFDSAWYNRGVALHSLGRFEDAISCYEKALELKPDNHVVWTNQGSALYSLGRFEDAISCYEKALELKPDNHVVWTNQGLTLDKLERHKEAISSYKKALELKPDNHAVWNNQGVLLGKLGRFKEAISCFQKVIDLKPDDVNGWTNQGVALGKLGRLDEAIYCFDKSIDLKPDDFSAWYNRGLILAGLRRLDDEIASYNKALELKPDYVDAWYNRGVALDNLGRFDEAINSYNKVLEIEPYFYLAWNNKGVASYKLGRLDDALTSYNKAISFNPKESFPWFNRIRVMFKLNNWDEGFKELDDALNRFANQKESHTGDTTEYIKLIWDSTRDINVWKSRIQTLVNTYDKHQVVSNLSKGMVDHIPTLMSEMVSDKLARTWLEIWQSIVGDKLELSIALRFLKIAVEYKETKGDRRILMKLAKEEREILEPLVRIQ